LLADQGGEDGKAFRDRSWLCADRSGKRFDETRRGAGRLPKTGSRIAQHREDPRRSRQGHSSEPQQSDFGQLFAELEDKDLPDLEQFAQADLANLRRIEAALGRTKANVTAAGQQLDRIYDDQIKNIGEAARKLVSERHVQIYLKGLDSKRQKEIDTFRRFLAAHAAVYDALHDQVLFLISANGRYSYYHGLQRTVFPNSEDLAKYNGLVQRLIAANRDLQSVEKEVAELEEYRPEKAQ
jgi:hypothetical protein